MQQINDLSARISGHSARIKAALSRVVDSGWLVLGPEVRRFEAAFAGYLGVGDCVTVANGTDAIELALRALGVGPGSKVATVANAGMYTGTALAAIGASPWFMDVDFDSRNVTMDEVVRAVEAGVQAVVVTHLYGLAAKDIASIAGYCRRKRVWLLEDCAQAHGARIDGKHVGTFGDAASFSFYPTKNLGALGDGGAVVTDHPTIADKVRLLRQYGWTAKYRVQLHGARNSRLDEMQAAVLSELLPFLDEANAQRRAIARKYRSGISHPLVKVPGHDGESYVGHLYVVTSPERDLLREHLRAEGIAAEVHYPIPDHMQPVYGDSYAGLKLEATEKLANEILTLPCYPEMSDAAVDAVIRAVNGWRA